MVFENTHVFKHSSKRQNEAQREFDMSKALIPNLGHKGLFYGMD